MSEEPEYVPVRVSTLRGDQAVPFRVYLRVGERFILYVRQGEAFDGKRLKKIKEKKLKKMFIQPGDEENYRHYVTQNIEMAYDTSSDMTSESRANIVQGHQQSSAEELMEQVEDEEVYNSTKQSASKYVDFLMNESDALKNILDMENTDNSVAHHGVSVATYAVALAQKLNVPEDQIKLLTLGCLVHDIAQSELNIPRATLALSEMNDEERTAYQEHPLKGANYVKDLQHFDPAVINIILQHEETIDGQGYPKQLSEKEIDPLAVIAGVANKIERITFEEKISRVEASKKLLIECVGKYPLEHLQMMQSIAKDLA